MPSWGAITPTPGSRTDSTKTPATLPVSSAEISTSPNQHRYPWQLSSIVSRNHFVLYHPSPGGRGGGSLRGYHQPDAGVCPVIGRLAVCIQERATKPRSSCGVGGSSCGVFSLARMLQHPSADHLLRSIAMGFEPTKIRTKRSKISSTTPIVDRTNSTRRAASWRDLSTFLVSSFFQVRLLLPT